MSKISRAEQVGRRQGEVIIEQAQLMYNKNTKNNFLKGIKLALRGESRCHTCFKKYQCINYAVDVGCKKYQDQTLVI